MSAQSREIPAAGAGGGEEEYLPVTGFENLLQVVEQGEREGWKIGGALVFHGDIHGKAHGQGILVGPGINNPLMPSMVSSLKYSGSFRIREGEHERVGKIPKHSEHWLFGIHKCGIYTILLGIKLSNACSVLPIRLEIGHEQPH
jgi:hypothetical protein